IACLLQAADEMRRTQRLAYRLAQLRKTHPGLGQDARAVWQDDRMWQPLREVVEKLLVTYDWGEAFVACNLVFKPMFDQLFLHAFGRLATACGDDVLAKILASLGEDAEWHRDFSRALIRTVIEENATNRAVIDGWIAAWQPRVVRALGAFGLVFDEMPG